VTDTIFALSSGAPPAAIAVVRISGPGATEALATLTEVPPEPRRLELRSLRDPSDGTLLDRALVTWFPAGASVTGEVLVELHLHGGRATVAAVERVLGTLPGLRPARAGEFTWAAFRNGRMSLVEVEALSDLLRAETESQRRAAVAGTGLARAVERWRQDVLLLSALLEARLDQSDEDDVPPDRTQIEALNRRLSEEMRSLLERPGAERLFDGVRVVFAGPPNAGKSSLINALVGREVAITSPVEGTTRDVIEAPVQIGGVAFVLTDVAGLREETDDPIEAEGIARARARLSAADLVVWMAPDAPAEVPPERLVRVHAKADLSGAGDGLRVSAVTGEGVAELARELVDRARRLLPREGEAALTRRQRDYLHRCSDALAAFAAEPDDLLAAEHLRRTRRALDELTGRAGTEEMLDALFGTFCIGK
jgi:tRNA modification GTPase